MMNGERTKFTTAFMLLVVNAVLGFWCWSNFTAEPVPMESPPFRNRGESDRLFQRAAAAETKDVTAQSAESVAAFDRGRWFRVPKGSPIPVIRHYFGGDTYGGSDQGFVSDLYDLTEHEKSAYASILAGIDQKGRRSRLETMSIVQANEATMNISIPPNPDLGAKMGDYFTRELTGLLGEERGKSMAQLLIENDPAFQAFDQSMSIGIDITGTAPKLRVETNGPDGRSMTVRYDISTEAFRESNFAEAYGYLVEAALNSRAN